MARQWTEQSVLDLIGRAGIEDPEEIIRDEVAQLLSDTGESALPIDVEAIASWLGIRSATGDFEFAGRIYADHDGQLIMNLNAQDEPPRRRFTCAHELIHTRFPGFERGRYRLDLQVGSNPVNLEEEYLCDFGAAELLMPRHLVEGAYRAQDGFGAVEDLAESARVSLEAAANRLVRLSVDPVALLVFRESHKPADGPALRRGEYVAKRLRLRYAVSNGLNAYFPRFKSADDHSVITKAWEGGDAAPCRAHEVLPGAQRAGVFRLEAKAYGSGELRKVLVLASPS